MSYVHCVARTSLCSAAVLILLHGCVGVARAAEEASNADAIELGARLFRERNFTNPAADYGSSCGECHADGSDVQGRPARVFADYTPQSLTATKEMTLRNTPTLLGVADHERLGWDGAHASLEELVFDKLLGPTMGWRPTDQERALAAIHFTLAHEGDGGASDTASYAEAIQGAYAVDVETMTIEEGVRIGSRAIADYVRSLRSTRTSPWDAFVSMNRLHPGPIDGETVENFAAGVWSRLGNQEGRQLVKRPKGFTQEAYRGFKTFFRTAPEGEAAVGNCVTCHVPPDFTDGQFHNAGVSEAAYDAVHGSGSAAAYGQPAAPSEATRSRPAADDRSRIDLGRFNVAPEEPGAVGAFKTPTLRSLAGTDPYMHDGAYSTLEDAVRAKMRAAEQARAGRLPWADPEIADIRIGEDDVAPLVAFLRQLHDVGRAGFRELLVNLEAD
ncbi:MAG TPA: cytochrome c peroxidase [Thermoanaerobaculia bacterium]|nr:cytochrome c peroxidase [Thermoanaerobaculia bacterium]